MSLPRIEASSDTSSIEGENHDPASLDFVRFLESKDKPLTLLQLEQQIALAREQGATDETILIMWFAAGHDNVREEVDTVNLELLRRHQVCLQKLDHDTDRKSQAQYLVITY